MKKNLLLLFTLFSFSTHAQSLLVEYAEKQNMESQINFIKKFKGNITEEEINHLKSRQGKSRDFNLFYENGVSLYALKQQPTKNERGIDEESKAISIGNEGSGLYKNPKTKEYLKEADIFGKAFLIKDTLPVYTWKLINEEKTIGSYLCKKAIAVVKTKEIIAWYTLSVPISDGPEDYYGLPGLIIELNTPEKTISAIKISNSPTKFNFQKPSKGTVISDADFNAAIKKVMDDLKSGNGNMMMRQ